FAGVLSRLISFHSLAVKDLARLCSLRRQKPTLHLPVSIANVRLIRRVSTGGICKLSLAQNKYFFFTEIIPAMNQQATASQKTRAEQETENEANRLREQIDAALAAVESRSPDEVDSLQSTADRIERAARDLADALRQIAQQRRLPEIS